MHFDAGPNAESGNRGCSHPDCIRYVRFCSIGYIAMERAQVEIYGQIYSIKGGEDSTEIRELAAYVDSKMKEVEKGTGTVDPLRVAILTALTIADELSRLRSRYDELEAAADRAVDHLVEITEGVSLESIADQNRT